MSTGDEASLKRRQMSEEQQSTMQEQEAQATIIPSAITNMNQRWKNWWIRGIFSFVMVGLFVIIIYMGPVLLSLMILVILLKAFQEVVAIGYSKYKEYNLPLYRVLSWYFMFVAAYFVFGDNFFYYYPEYKAGDHGPASLLAQYHRIISFSLYIVGFVMFVLTLKKDNYQIQFGMFGWTHITLFILLSPAYLLMQNMFEGLFWFLLPISLVICNDITAYLSGFFFGRTQLIKLSPKKTWEGFIGAFICTFIFGFILAYFLAKYDYFVCYQAQSQCERTLMFTLQEYNVGSLSFHLYPAQLHSFPLSIFASLIAPFGGFFASGFKRAFNIKDFADVIPGHGGIMDRFDCQILMAIFANLYYFTFCRSPNPDKLLSMVLALPLDRQLEIFEQLQDRLTDSDQ